MKSLKKNSIFNIIYTVLSLLFPLISSMYIARILQAAGVGKVAFATNYVSYFTIFASLGIPNYGIREIAKRRNNKIERDKFFSEILLINFFTTSIALLIYIISIICIYRFRTDFHLYVACGFMIVLNYFNIDWYYQGEEKYGYIVIRSFFTKFMAFLALLVFVKTREDYVKYAWISSLAVAGNNIFNIIHAHKSVIFTLSNLNIRRHIMPIVVMAAGVLVSTIYGKIDLLMLGIMIDDVHTGFYSNGYKIINMIVTICSAMTTVFMPRLSLLYEENQKEFTNILNKGISLLIFITIPMFIAVFLLADQVSVVMFGSKFLPVGDTIRALSLLIIIKGIGNLVCFQLVICTGNEKERLPATLLGSSANVVLNFLMIRPFFEMGAAIASVISEVIVNGYQFIKMKKVVQIETNKKNIFQCLFASIVMGTVIAVICHFVQNSLLTCILSFISGISVYIVITYVLKNVIVLTLLNIVKSNIFRIMHR